PGKARGLSRRGGAGLAPAKCCSSGAWFLQRAERSVQRLVIAQLAADVFLRSVELVQLAGVLRKLRDDVEVIVFVVDVLLYLHDQGWLDELVVPCAEVDRHLLVAGKLVLLEKSNQLRRIGRASLLDSSEDRRRAEPVLPGLDFGRGTELFLVVIGERLAHRGVVRTAIVPEL